MSKATGAPAGEPAGVTGHSTMRGPLASAGVVLAAGAVVMALFAQAYVGSVFVLALTYAIVTAGMAVQIGFSQQVAFSQSVFMGFGAYGVALLNTRLAMPSMLATLVVTLASGVVAIVLGAIVSRASGLALAVATITFPFIAVGYVSSASYLGGNIGMPLTGPLWPSSSSSATAAGNGFITVAVAGVVVFVATRILSSDAGLELYVLGVDEGMAIANGVSTARRRLELFVLGSMFAALGGAVYAGTQMFVPATLVDATAELSLLMMLFVGGRRSVLGAVIGAFAIEYVSGQSNFVSVNILIVEGVLITVVLLVEPEGLAGIAVRLMKRARRSITGGAATAGGVSVAVTAYWDPATAGPQFRAAWQRQLAGAATTATTAAAAAADGGTAGVPPNADGSAAADGSAGSTGPARSTGSVLLECAGIGKDYGALRVLDDVSLALPTRGIFALCGPNGAGKSTLLNIIGGSVTPSEGTVFYGGADVARMGPPERFRRGVSRTFQAVHLIPGRTVLDNVAVACLGSHRSSLASAVVRNRLNEARGKAMAALEYLGMEAVSGTDVAALTLEGQRMVELARAIASKPRLLLLDEPASGLSEPQRERLKRMLRAIGELTCVLLVEHDLGLVAATAERIFVLASGRLVFAGDPDGFRASEVVNSLLVGL